MSKKYVQAKLLNYAKCTKCYDHGFWWEDHYDGPHGKFDKKLYSCFCKATKIRTIRSATKLMNIYPAQPMRGRRYWLVTNKELDIIIRAIKGQEPKIQPRGLDYDDDIPF